MTESNFQSRQLGSLRGGGISQPVAASSGLLLKLGKTKGGGMGLLKLPEKSGKGAV